MGRGILFWGMVLVAQVASAEISEVQEHELIAALSGSSAAHAREELLKAGGAERPAVQAAISKWIEQLDDADFSKREEASRVLFEAGDLAVPKLREAVKTENAEARWRAVKVLGPDSYTYNTWHSVVEVIAEQLLLDHRSYPFHYVLAALKQVIADDESEWKKRITAYQAYRYTATYTRTGLRIGGNSREQFEYLKARAELLSDLAQSLRRFSIQVKPSEQEAFELELHGHRFRLSWIQETISITSEDRVYSLRQLMQSALPPNGRIREQIDPEGNSIPDGEFTLQIDFRWDPLDYPLERARLGFSIEGGSLSALQAASAALTRVYKRHLTPSLQGSPKLATKYPNELWDVNIFTRH